jgi:hypothetical protein
MIKLSSFLFLLSSSEILLAHPSLFFTQEEIDSLSTQDNEPEKLNLSAIVYLDKDHWSLWINDKVIRPENRDELPGFTIEEVTPFEVRLSSPSSSALTLCLF